MIPLIAQSEQCLAAPPVSASVARNPSTTRLGAIRAGPSRDAFARRSEGQAADRVTEVSCASTALTSACPSLTSSTSLRRCCDDRLKQYASGDYLDALAGQ